MWFNDSFGFKMLGRSTECTLKASMVDKQIGQYRANKSIDHGYTPKASQILRLNRKGRELTL